MAISNHVFRSSRICQATLLALGLAACAGYAARAQNTAPAAPKSALPSGLASVTELSVNGSQIALDSNGNLFRSDDKGKHWRPVKQQWAGKAVELLGIPALTDAPGSGQAAKTEQAPATYAALLLRSTSALHWVSVDRGKTWQPSTLDDVRRNDVKWSASSDPKYFAARNEP